MTRSIFLASLAVALVCGLCQCASTSNEPADVVVSVKEQKLAVYDGDGHLSRKYPVSTSKYGLSDKPRSYGTPTGLLEVVAKIGHGAPAGAVFKGRQRTGEVIKPDAPGRDPIVSRIMWLRGLESGNKNAYGRGIYIHGTPEERLIGRPASYGCIRMKSADVIELFERLPIGTRVMITDDPLPATVAVNREPRKVEPASSRPPLRLNPDAEQEKPVMVAQNSTSSRRAPAPAAAAAAGPSSSGYQSRASADGSTVIYSSTPGGSPPVMLRSRRSATQGLSD